MIDSCIDLSYRKKRCETDFSHSARTLNNLMRSPSRWFRGPARAVPPPPPRNIPGLDFIASDRFLDVRAAISINPGIEFNIPHRDILSRPPPSSNSVTVTQIPTGTSEAIVARAHFGVSRRAGTPRRRAARAGYAVVRATTTLSRAISLGIPITLSLSSTLSRFPSLSLASGIFRQSTRAAIW